jgi:hypothetical protein
MKATNANNSTGIEGGDLPFGDTVLAVPVESASERGGAYPKIETT